MAVAEGQLRWENMNLTRAENLKLITAQKLTLSLRILVAYPRLNQGEWVFPLVHSLRKLDSVVSGEAQSQRIIYSIKNKIKNKRNLSESDSENGAADFLRFIVIESLKEVCWAKFSFFLIE